MISHSGHPQMEGRFGIGDFSFPNKITCNMVRQSRCSPSPWLKGHGNGGRKDTEGTAVLDLPISYDNRASFCGLVIPTIAFHSIVASLNQEEVFGMG